MTQAIRSAARPITSPRRGEVGAERRERGSSPFRTARSPLSRLAALVDLSPPGRGEAAAPSAPATISDLRSIVP
jgi:hypothetical protein